jgi:Zn-dependent peptidase ImmA (M78 family)
MDKPRIEFARQLARKILKNCGIIQPPVNLQSIVSKLGYIYIEVPNFPDRVDALFIEKDREKYIAVNADHHPHRKRFSVAHELGHIQMGHALEYYDEPIYLENPITDKTHSEKEKNLEKEANAFASELLIPLEILKVEFRKMHDIDELSKVFFVSSQAMSVAIMNHQKLLFG